LTCLLVFIGLRAPLLSLSPDLYAFS
jgi:hypothetical protein